MAHAQSLILYTAELHWADQSLMPHVEKYTAWSVGRATRSAWGRARSLMLSGEAVAFTTRHREQVVVH